MALDSNILSTSTKSLKLIYGTLFHRHYYRRNWQRFETLVPKGNIPENPVTWKQPEKLQFHHPWKTADLVRKHPSIDMTRHPDIIADSVELANASDAVKRMFSFDYTGRYNTHKQIKSDMIASVRNHRYDDDSLESIIASYTATIRTLYEHLETYPYDRRCRSALNSIMNTRFHRLTDLRQSDYKRFEWLLEKLDLRYQPKAEEFTIPQREDSIRILTDQYIENYKQERLSKYRMQLEERKEEFLKEKVVTLMWMRKEEIECGVEEPSITLDIIKEAEKQLQDHHEALRRRVVVEDTSANILK